ncbi:ABC transporter ATP-binding protein [Flavihumibacter profundi]|jgi:ABC-2 type transport system ATP-binding protein|uniref:ABC transporter ATP-binding protein n=1 Tax=Flavihumibacter profundi TaxID=2716883 RepID=UPI001CC73B63|nr:ABC transporter ATP-binding protein [Flavihumibacter profundi]MBZ5858731.1 ABC transporter ATP-binding protein [Flavihumibacter profundi]
MEPIIRIQSLFKSYGSKQVLNNISLDIFPGQVIGYIGPNGAGKSTTVKILCGLLPDFEGSVTVKGISLREDPLSVKRIIGYVPELAELYEVLTAAEFLELVAGLYEIPPDTAQTRIHRMLNALGLEANMHQRMDTFSKGMRQKVLLISGLIHNPDILILDEPLSGLDANSVIIIKELISKLAAEGKTIFYCSHMMDVVEKVSDRIVLINNGVIVADGSFASLQQSQGQGSLENIFAQLTASKSLHDAAASLVSAFGNETATTPDINE